MNDKKKDWKNSSLLPMLVLVTLVLIFGAGAVFLYFEQIDSSQNTQEIQESYQERSAVVNEQNTKSEETTEKKKELDKKLDKLKKDATNTDYFEGDGS